MSFNICTTYRGSLLAGLLLSLSPVWSKVLNLSCKFLRSEVISTHISCWSRIEVGHAKSFTSKWTIWAKRIIPYTVMLKINTMKNCHLSQHIKNLQWDSEILKLQNLYRTFRVGPPIQPTLLTQPPPMINFRQIWSCVDGINKFIVDYIILFHTQNLWTHY